MTEDVPLFPGFESPEEKFAADPLAELSPGQRRTLRQAGDVRNGRHPLTKGPLHPEASREAAPGGSRSKPFTCGGCKHLASNGDYLKCFLPGLNGRPMPWRLSHSEATDVRRWWPACPDYEPGRDVHSNPRGET